MVDESRLEQILERIRTEVERLRALAARGDAELLGSP